MELLIGTRNRGKYAEIAEALVPLRLQLRGVFDFPGVPECPESAVTYEENAAQKALHYSAATGLPTLADDSGLEVAALDGGPGPLSARYGGDGLTDADRCRRLLGALNEIPEGRRQARFIAAVALVSRGRVVGRYRGEAEGIILREPRGDGGFGYDPIFFFSPLHLTFAQLLPAVKRQVSHRGKALALAAAALHRDPEILR